jgi:hypothetical protein
MGKHGPLPSGSVVVQTKFKFALVTSFPPGVYTVVAELALVKVPPPPLHDPVAGVVVTWSDAVELLQIVMGVRGVKLAGVETVNVA